MRRFMLIFLFLIIGYVLYWNTSNYLFKAEKEKRIIGEYVLDLHRTNLDIYKDSIAKYKHLKLTFKTDNTFSFSFSVPFMADTCGTWKVGGMGEWCKIIYHNHIEDQFGAPYREGTDSVLYINSATPQLSQRLRSNVYQIFFKKIK